MKILSIENEKKWMDALESGKYPKGTVQLKTDNKYCCLGVLACVLGKTIDSLGTQLIGKEDAYQDSLGLPLEVTEKLYLANDDRKYYDDETFENVLPEIKKIIKNFRDGK